MRGKNLFKDNFCFNIFSEFIFKFVTIKCDVSMFWIKLILLWFFISSFKSLFTLLPFFKFQTFNILMDYLLVSFKKNDAVLFLFCVFELFCFGNLWELIEAQYLLRSIFFGSANKLIINTDQTPLTSLNTLAFVPFVFLNKMCSIKSCIDLFHCWQPNVYFN